MPQDPAEKAPEHIQVRRAGSVYVVSFNSTYLQAEDEIAKVMAEVNALVDAQKPNKVVLAFDGVRFVSSTMLAQVVRLHNKLAKAKARLRVCGLAPAVRDVVRASQLDKLLDVHDDENAALAKF
jgi:anti-anti-sigma factor